MESLDVLQVPTLSLLSSSSNNTSSGQSALSQRISGIVRKKLYRRTARRLFPTSPSLRRSSSSKSSPPYKSRRHKQRPLYTTRRSRESTNAKSSSSRSGVSPLDTANRSTSTNSSTGGPVSTVNRQSPGTPRSGQNFIVIESDDDEDIYPVTPSPIRDSPLYRRRSRRRDAILSATTPTPSAVSYPELPTETSTTFVRYHPGPMDDTTIDSKLIHMLRKGPTGDCWNYKLGKVYTAVMEGEPGFVKIGWTEQDISERIAGLNSPASNGRIKNAPDTTPGAQSSLYNGYFAERIIQRELYNFRRKAVDLDQTEWFEIDEKEAHRVCHKWRVWLMQEQPYDENRKLKEFWRDRLYLLETQDSYEAGNHRCLHERWMKFLNPSWWDRRSYEVLSAQRKISNYLKWIRENFQMILFLVGIVLWVSCPIVIFLGYISVVWVVWTGLSTTTEPIKPTKAQDKRRRVTV